MRGQLRCLPLYVIFPQPIGNGYTNAERTQTLVWGWAMSGPVARRRPLG